MEHALALDEANEVIQMLSTDERDYSAKQPPHNTQDPSTSQSVPPYEEIVLLHWGDL